MKRMLLLALIGLLCLGIAHSASAQVKNKRHHRYGSVLTIDSSEYHMIPHEVTLTIHEGDPEKNFSVSICQDEQQRNYNYSVLGYGKDFPPYAILGGSSGGVQSGTWTILLRLAQGVFTSDGNSAKKYETRIPIHIWHSGVENLSDGNTLFVSITITVLPKE